MLSPFHAEVTSVYLEDLSAALSEVADSEKAVAGEVRYS